MPTSTARAWATLLELLGALAGQYRDDFRQAVIGAGLIREPVGMLLHAGDIDPRPLTVAGLLACVPYYAKASFMVPMQRLAAGGWIEAAGAGYRLTSKGRAATDAMYSAARRKLASLSPLPAADLDRLAQLLRRLLAACQASALVTDQACLAASGNAASWQEPTPMATIARALEALTNFRCDAHRAAWHPTDLDGPAWEALTWLWEGRADSAAGLQGWSEKQPHPRAFSVADYAACLATLSEHGWTEALADGRFTLTDAGRNLRQAVEDQTDANFYGPWRALSTVEIDELDLRARAIVDALRTQ
jgi:hypothetical protein